MNVTLTQWQPWLELILKSVIVLVVAGGLCVALRKTATGSAAVRHLVLSFALVALLVLPLLTRALPAWRLPVLAAATPVEYVPALAEVEIQSLPMAETPAPDGLVEAAPPPEKSVLPAFDATTMVWLVWLLGVAVVLARLALGAWRMRGITQAAQPVANNHWALLLNDLKVQLDLPARVTLYLSTDVNVPVTWGVWHPRVILPVEASRWSSDWQRIVLLHELAHIKRRDCLTQLLANVACAIYWFNPLVWRAARQLRVERELACDDCVLAVGTRATDYASCLVAIARSFHLAETHAVAVGMACSELEGRVRTMLDPAIERRWLSGRRQFVLVALAAALLLPLAALQAVSKEIPAPTSSTELAKDFVSTATGVLAQASQNPVSPASPAPLPAPVPVVSPVVAPVAPSDAVVVVASPVITPTVNVQVASAATANVNTNVVSGVDFDVNVNLVQGGSGSSPQGLSPDDLIQLKIHNITTDYIEAIRQAGYADVNVRQLVELKVQGITAATIREMQALSDAKLSLRDIVRLKVSGLTAAYISAMKQLGLSDSSLNQYSQMKLLGVTPEYAAEMKRAGLNDLNARQLTQLKAMGVTESYVQQVKSWGLANINASEILRLKTHNVRPEDGQQFKALGFESPSLQDLIRLKTHGVTADYIKEIRALGFEKLTLDEAIKFKIHGITPDYVRQMRAAGFKNISSNELLKLKIQGLDSILLKK